ncbi:MAG: glycosyl transferase family 2 [Amphiplicatus sp.]
MPGDYTFVLTSCGRFDLLARTLQSFYAHVDLPPAAAIVIEDSGDRAVEDVVRPLGRDIAILINDPRLGQMKSIDRAYQKVETPYIFHCEDDWEFIRTGFIADSFALLDALPDVSAVNLRARAALNRLLRDAPRLRHEAIDYFLSDPKRHPEYFGYSFNPGLRRRADYERLGPFAALGHEAEVSYAFKKAGFRMAYLEAPAVIHIGDERHVDDPHGPRRPRNQWQRLQRSIEKRVKRVRRFLAR